MIHAVGTADRTLCGQPVGAVLAAGDSITPDSVLVDCLHCLCDLVADHYSPTMAARISEAETREAERAHKKLSAARRQERDF